MFFGQQTKKGGSLVPSTQITLAALNTALSANTLDAGFYLITNATSTRVAGAKADRGILVQAYKDSGNVSRVRLEAEGAFLNPDFQDAGNYSGVVGLTGVAKATNRGVWFSAETGFVLGDITFWNGLHYQLTNAAAKNGTNPATNVAAYTLLPKTTANMGYIAESDFIEYDLANDWIQRRIDKRGNDISMTKEADTDWMTAGQSSTAYFQWGRNECYGNIAKNALIHAYNAVGYHRGNRLEYGAWMGFAGSENSVAATKEISYNILGAKSYIESNVCTQNIIENTLMGTSTIKDNTVNANVARNTLNDGSNISGNTINGPVSYNNLTLGSIESSTVNAEANVTSCVIESMSFSGKTVATPVSIKTGNRIASNFIEAFTITGATTIDLIAAQNITGIANLSSTNAAESINLFSNFPDYHAVRFYPESGLTVTFVHNTGANQPRCEGATNAVLNGTNGDWIEFTKKEDGFIYQTNIGTY